MKFEGLAEQPLPFDDIPAVPQNCQQLVEELHAMAVERNTLELQLKDITQKEEMLKMKLHDKMVSESVEEISIRDGDEVIKYRPDTMRNFQLMPEGGDSWDDNDKFFAWLEQQKLDGAVKVKRGIHHATRKKLLEEFIDGGGTLPTWIREYFFNTVKFSDEAVKRIAKAQAKEVMKHG